MVLKQTTGGPPMPILPFFLGYRTPNFSRWHGCPESRLHSQCPCSQAWAHSGLQVVGDVTSVQVLSLEVGNMSFSFLLCWLECGSVMGRCETAVSRGGNLGVEARTLKEHSRRGLLFKGPCQPWPSTHGTSVRGKINARLAQVNMILDLLSPPSQSDSN